MRLIAHFWMGFLLIVCQPVHAHKIVTSVWVEGNSIEGEVGFSNGDMAREGTRVEVLGPSGDRLGEVVTDAEGLFRFTPTKAVAHTFRAELGSGHVATATLEVDELPVTLVSTVPENNEAHPELASPASEGKPQTSLPRQDLQLMISAAVQRQIRPLRKDLNAYKEKNDLQSILGGIGYICGIFGLLFFFYARCGKSGA